MDNLRQKLLAKGISERASNLITKNERTSSIKHYESAWKKGASSVLNGRYLPLDRK